MKLAELAFACYIYGQMTNFDDSYNSFREKTAPQIDLNRESHRKALLKWLNDWGCRQFILKYHSLASEEILNWYLEVGNQFHSIDKYLLELTDSDFAVVKYIFNELVDRTAGRRVLRGGGQSQIEFGPTGTAKILFALMPNSMIPWDIPMRKKFHYKGTAIDYVHYLKFVRKNLEEIKVTCERNGFELLELPQMLGRPKYSLTKLMDEYFWVTVSNKCPIPSHQELNQWAQWW